MIGRMSEVRLDQILSRLPSGLPLPVACWLVSRVANAIAAQPRLITPRDIRVREDGGVRVADAEGETPFAYRAPENLRGGDPNPRSAVFALGAVLVETLSGRSAFERGSDMETRVAVAAEEVAPMKGRVAQASHALDAILARALAKSPDDRFASTVELAERLDGFLEDELHDVGPEAVVAAVRAAIGGGDPRAAFQKVSEESVVRPLPTEPEPTPPATNPSTAPSTTPSTPGRVPMGGLRAPTGARPDGIRAPRRPTPGPSEMVAAARRPTPAPSHVVPAPRRPTPPPSTPAAQADDALPPLPELPPDEPVRLRPARPAPAAPAPAAPAAPTQTPAPTPAAPAASHTPSYSNAELDLKPQGRRLSVPNKPRFDEGLVRLGDPSGEAGAGITDASVTGVRDSASAPKPKAVAGLALDIDESALQQERARPATVREDPPPPAGPNWLLRIGLLMVGILAAAIAYQFVLRPFLRE